MKLNGRWFPQIVDIGTVGIYILYSLVLIGFMSVRPSRIGVVLRVRDFWKIQEKVTKNLVFLHTLYKMGGTLCARLSPNRFTYLHILGANQLYNHCRCATYLSF